MEEARLRLAEATGARDFQLTAQGMDALTRAHSNMVKLDPGDGARSAQHDHRRDPGDPVMAVAIALILTGCSGGAGADAAPKADAIVKAFTDAGLPAEQPRDNTSKGWYDDAQYGCKQFYTTENVTVITAPSKDRSKRANSGESASGFYVSKDGRVMLSFLAQGTAVDQQATYEQTLEKYQTK